MKPQITLYLTKHPVHDIQNPESGKARFTAWILENLKISATLTGPLEMTANDFTRNAISWAKSQLKSTGLAIDLVAGDSAVQQAVEAAGLKYHADPNLRSLPVE